MFTAPTFRLLSLTSLIVAAAMASADDRPNIIFLMADDQATYSMGCYDTPGAKTPNLDQLADDGMVFDAHYDTTAICMASRANVMTGMFEYKTGCNFEHGALLSDHWVKTYPMLLRMAGYKTGFAGKFGFEVTDRPEKRGCCRRVTLMSGEVARGRLRMTRRRISPWRSMSGSTRIQRCLMERSDGTL